MVERIPAWSIRSLTLVPLALCLAIPAQAAKPAAKPTVSMASLLDDMADPTAPARWPEAEFRLKQVSSYDRRSKMPGNDDWFANHDWSNFLRTGTVKTANGERTEYVMLEDAGPGAIVRFWAGGFTDRGIVRIYIDGAKEPILSGTADELVGGTFPFGVSKYFPRPFAATQARGLNLYAPIPYAKSIKITYDGPMPTKADHPGTEGFFYNINYRSYDASTRIEAFALTSLDATKEQMAAVAKAMSDQAMVDYTKNGRLEPKQKFVTELGKGPGAITRLQLHLNAPDMEAALRQTVVSISFDGRKTVEVPAGDFFGTGVGINPFEDRWQHVDVKGNMAVRWVMPYRERVEITLENHGSQPVEYALANAKTTWSWDKRSLYFHASWRRQASDTSKKSDFNYLTAQGGRGVYMGDTLSVFNPVPAWWGEGDEKVWIDGESFPSHFGTGTEDYYGYAWGAPELFQSPFHAQPRTGVGQQGHVTNTRVRVLDGIPFNKSLKFDIEAWHWASTKVDYAVATFWYGDAVATSNVSLDPTQLSVPGR